MPACEANQGQRQLCRSQKALKPLLPRASLILEDNVEIPNDFSEQVENILTALIDDEPDIIHLYSTLSHERPFYKENIYKGFQEWGTAKAQLVSRRFAEFAIASLPISLPSDGLNAIPSKAWMNTGLNSFITIPSVTSIHSAFDSIRSSLDINSADGQPCSYDHLHFVSSTRQPRLFYAADKDSATPRVISIFGQRYNYAIELNLYELLSWDECAKSQASAIRVVSIDQMAVIYQDPSVCRFSPLDMLSGNDFHPVPVHGCSDELIYAGGHNTFYIESLRKVYSVYPSELLLPAVYYNSHSLAFPGSIYLSSLDSRL